MKTETLEYRAAVKAWEPYTIAPKDLTESVALAVIKTLQLCRDNEPIDKLLDSLSLDAENEQAVRFAYAAWWNDRVTQRSITEEEVKEYLKTHENLRRGTDDPKDFDYDASEIQDLQGLLL